ncbi:MAG: hypothetical protein HKN23_07775 [Verrucomicrobiales bacterium]|nr:hypothetical protein [Verrucomicrobiales bacterium]
MKFPAAFLLLALSLSTLCGQDEKKPAQPAPWKAGAAATVITPEKNMWMAGYGGRKAPSEGKFTDLWAKALVLDDDKGNRGLILTLDLVGIDRELAGKVCEQLKAIHGFDREAVAICTSHTHSGPVVGKNLAPLHYLSVDPEQQKLIDEYAETLVEKIVEVSGKAIAAIAPARLQWGSGKSTFAVNRRENKPYSEVPDRRARGLLKGPVDHDVPVLSVRDGEGNLKAVLFGYACHATVIGLQKWSGDYPGYAQIELEKANPGCIALFWAGCGGDQNPLPRREVKYAEEYGAELAEAVGEVLAAPMPDLPAKLSLMYEEIDLSLAKVPTPDEIKAEGKSLNRFEVARSKYLLRKIENQGGLKGNYPFPIGFWKIGGGEVEFITLGGEVTVEYALRLKRERAEIRTWVAAYANDVMAYIPSLKVLKEGGYEGGGSNVYYGLPALWSENIEEEIVKGVNALGN